MKKMVVIIIVCLFMCSCKSISHAHKEYYCEEGTLYYDVCKVEEIADLQQVCEGSDVLEDGKCKTKEMEIDASVGNVCGKGYSYYEKMCISDKTEDRIPTATCPEAESEDYKIEPGYLTCFKYKCEEKDDEGKCIKYSDKAEEIEPDIEYSCPSGYKYVYYKCRKIYYPYLDYVCPSGVLEGNKCVFYSYYDPDLKCDDDYELNKENMKCKRVYYVDANTK